MTRRTRAGILIGVILALLLTGLTAWLAYPLFSFEEAFRRSRPALDAYAEKVRSSPAALASPPSRLGYFRVLHIEPLPHGFLFQHDSGHPFDWTGLAYSTEPLPEDESDAQGQFKQSFTPIEGNWYYVFRQ